MDVDGAIADFTKAADISPAEADPYYKRGHARLIKEDFDGAVADFDKALGLVERQGAGCAQRLRRVHPPKQGREVDD